METHIKMTQEEIMALKSIGVIAENWFAVCYNSNSMPIAIFCNEDYAKAYRDQFTKTSIIEPWPMVIRDYRHGRKDNDMPSELHFKFNKEQI